jgi:hypothetical protein
MTRAAMILGAGDSKKASTDMKEVLDFEVKMARAASKEAEKRKGEMVLDEVIHIKVRKRKSRL